MTPVVYAWLAPRLARFADREALIGREGVLRYGDIEARIAEWRRILDDHALPRNAVVGIRGDYTPEVVSLFFALACDGYIVAPVPAAVPEPDSLLDLAHAQGYFDFVESKPWSFSRLAQRPPPPLLRQLTERRTPGLIVFSSGTTGESKVVLFDFGVLLKRYQQPRRAYRTLAFLSLDHLGGINTLLHAIACGGTVVVSEDRRPEPICQAVERHRVEVLPTTPTFLRMLVISGLYERYDLSSLRLVTYGTEPMPSSTLRHLSQLFPKVRFKQTYGLTELGVLPTRSKASESLWLQVGGIGCDSRIEDNVLWIRSETAMLGYLNAPSPFDEEGWYKTGDLVEVDGPYIRILGRSGDVINVGGEKVHPIEVENILLEVDNVREATVWGHDSSVTGQVVAARVSVAEPEDSESVERRIVQTCRQRLPPYKVPVYVEIDQGEHHGERFKKVRPRADAAPGGAGKDLSPNHLQSRGGEGS